MIKKDRNKEVSFTLVDITTEEFASFKGNFQERKDEFDIAFDVDVKVNAIKRTIGVFTKYQFDQASLPVVVIQCGCHFELEETFWEDHIIENKLTLKKDLLTHMLVLTVGTSRGVLHAKKPSWLNDLILPTLNVTSVFMDDVVFDLNVEEE